MTGDTQYNWGIIFIPVWVMLISYCTTPCMNVIDDFGSFMAGVILGWIPITIISVCLTMKLDSFDHVISHTQASSSYSYTNMKLALIFIPLWVIEGLVMVLSFGFFISAYLRYRMGYIDTYVVEIGGMGDIGYICDICMHIYIYVYLYILSESNI